MSIVPQILVNGVIAGSIYGLIALGFNLIYGTVKFFDIAYGGIVLVGGYGAYLFAKLLGLPLGVGMVFGVLACSVLGWGIYKAIYVPLRARKASNMIFLVASLGLFTMIQALVAIAFTSQFQTILSGVQHVVTIGTVAITVVQIAIIATFVVLFVTLGLVLKYSRLGKAIRAVADDEEVSSIMGINTGRIVGWVFVIGAAIGGLSGMMVGFDTGLEPMMGFSLLLKGVIAAIIGGVGSIYGGALGALMLGLIENLGIWQLSAEWKDVIAFGVLILFLVFRPQGIFKK